MPLNSYSCRVSVRIYSRFNCTTEIILCRSNFFTPPCGNVDAPGLLGLRDRSLFMAEWEGAEEKWGAPKIFLCVESGMVSVRIQSRPIEPKEPVITYGQGAEEKVEGGSKNIFMCRVGGGRMHPSRLKVFCFSLIHSEKKEEPKLLLRGTIFLSAEQTPLWHYFGSSY